MITDKEIVIAAKDRALNTIAFLEQKTMGYLIMTIAQRQEVELLCQFVAMDTESVETMEFAKKHNFVDGEEEYWAENVRDIATEIGRL